MTKRPEYPYPDATGLIVAKKVRVGARSRAWLAAHHDADGKVTRWTKGQPEDWSPGLWPADSLERETTTEPNGSLTVYITEGESDALAMRKLGEVCAYSVPNGAGSWQDEWAEPLGRPSVAQVYVVADNDDVGLRHAAVVATALRRLLTVPVGLLRPADGAKDAREHLGAGRSVAALSEASAADLAKWMSAGPTDGPVAGSSKAKAKKADKSVPLPEAVTRRVDRAVVKAKTEGRNHAGIWLATQLRDDELSRTQLTAVLVNQYAPQVNGKGRPRDPYRDAEAKESVRQALKRPAREPATSPDRTEDEQVAVELARLIARDRAKELYERVKDADADYVLRAVRAEFLVRPETQPDHLADLLTDDDIRSLPPVEWVVEGWVPRGTYTVIYGPPGVGKTLALLGMTRAVRRGTRWQDHRTDTGATVYYQGEGMAQFRDRIEAWDEQYPLRKDQSMNPGLHSERVVDLTKPEGVAAIIRTVRGVEDSTKTKVRLLVIDPLVEFMTGEENGEGMELVSRGLRALAKLLDVGVVVGHHSNASGERERGAAFLRMRAGAVVRMEINDDTESIGLVQQKQRNGEPVAMVVEMVSVAESVVLEYQNNASSLDVATYSAAQGHRKSEAKNEAKNEALRTDQKKVINALREAATPLTTNKLGQATGLNTRRLNAVVTPLIRDRIVVTTDGSNKAVLHELAEDWKAVDAKWDL